MLLRVLLSFVFILNINNLFLEVFPQEAGGQEMPAAGQGVSGEGQPPGAAENGQAAEAGGRQKVNKKVSQNPPLLEIKPLRGKKPLYSIELRDVELRDFFRVVAHDYNLNFLIDKDVTGKVTVSLTNISLKEALERIARINNLILEKSGDISIIKPNLITKIFTLRHIEAKSLLEISTGTKEGNLSEGSSSSSAGTTGAGVPSEASSSAGGSEMPGMSGGGSRQEGKAAVIYDFLSDKGKILLGEQPNSIMVVDYPKNVERIEAYLKMADKEMMSKIFKLKYISAKDIVGKSGSSASSTEGTPDSTAAGSSTEGTSDNTAVSASGGG